VSVTSIEWTDRSTNPLRAYHKETGKRGWFCVHASAGCNNCYAERMNRWVGNRLHYRAQDQKHVQFEMDVKELQSWQRFQPGTRVFPFDMTDLFQEGVADELIAQAFAAMASAPMVKFQVLTKRARRASLLLNSDAFRLMVSQWCKGNLHRRVLDAPLAPYREWPLFDVWLGVSVEDQATADERIPLLLQTPAAKRFVSYEPALGPVDFRAWLPDDGIGGVEFERWLDWIIVGGESGPGARPFDVSWARSTVEQCRAAGVAVFVKQIGSRPYGGPFVDAPGERNTHRPAKASKGGDPSEWSPDLRVREFPR
jgi:protein gp37